MDCKISHCVHRRPPGAVAGRTRSIGCCRITLIVSIYIISTLDIYTICDVVMVNCH